MSGHKNGLPPVDAGKEAQNQRAVDVSCDSSFLDVAGQSVKAALDWARGGAVDAPRRGAPPPPSALPCQNSNNSPQLPQKKGYKLHQTATYFRGQTGRATKITATLIGDRDCSGFDSSGRLWMQNPDEAETWICSDKPSASEARTAFALRRNIEAFASHYSRDNCGFMTLTPERDGMTPREFGVAWDNMRKSGRGHSGLSWVLSYARVLEPQKRGAPHYHLCVATPYDLKPDAFNWDALNGASEARKRGELAEARRLTRVYAQSAPDCLRQCWADLRRLCRRHGLGRSEFLPFRKESGAVAEYIGKYLEGGLLFRRPEWKGVRRVEYDRKESRKWKDCGVQFGWVSPGAREWRLRVADLAAAVVAETPELLRSKLGQKWCYHMRADIMTASPVEWYNLLSKLAVDHGGKLLRSPFEFKVGGQSCVLPTPKISLD